jgi:drug/metabolite transporter (DMT)-like permease
MSNLFNRVAQNWKTSAGGVLSVAGIVFTVLNQNPHHAAWIGSATAIVAGLTGLLAKDK